MRNLPEKNYLCAEDFQNVYENGQDGDYQEGDVDQEGMDIEYFSQYKVGLMFVKCVIMIVHNSPPLSNHARAIFQEREEFDGRTGMFQVFFLL